MKCLQTKSRCATLTALLYAFIATWFLVFNPQALRYDAGSANGIYIDRVDSFSEYIIRNTVKDRILNSANHSPLPIFTKGYPDDLRYFPDGSHQYYSNPTLQTVPAVWLAKLLHLNTESKLDALLGFLRYANAFLLAFFVCYFLVAFARRENLAYDFAIPFLVGGASGLVFFSGNLYFFSALMFLPAAFIAWNARLDRYRMFPWIALVSLPYFLRGYEFSTLFALVTALAGFVFSEGSARKRLTVAANAFGAVVVAFIIAAATHVTLVRIWAPEASTWAAAARTAFANVAHRTMTTSGVPAPFGTAFLASMTDRWNAAAFSLTPASFQLTELDVILLVLVALAVRARRASATERAIYGYAVFAYASWFVLAYQHIMWHGMYEWYIFAVSFGMAFSMLALKYLDQFISAIASQFARNAS